MRSINRLIKQIRRQTENEEFDDQFIGISDDEIIQYINDAQYNLQALIVQQHPRAFINEVIIDIVSGQESYALPTDCFLGNKIHNVEFSATGRLEDYYVLDQETIKSRISGVDGSPTRYIRLSNKILLVPQPSSGGKIRINYVQRLRELDKRQARVLTEFDISSTQAKEIFFDEANLTTDIKALLQHEYICLVDKLGNSIVKNIPIKENSLTETGNSLMIEAHTVSEGEPTTISVASPTYIVGGLDTTTHADVDISVERYLISYTAYKMLKRDSSVDSAEAAQELAAMAQEIVKSYTLITDDVQYIPQLTSWEDWSF